MDLNQQNPVNKYRVKRSLFDIDKADESLLERKRLNHKEIAKDKICYVNSITYPINKMDIDASFNYKLSIKPDHSKLRLQSIINDKKKYLNQNKKIEEGTQYDEDCCN